MARNFLLLTLTGKFLLNNLKNKKFMKNILFLAVLFTANTAVKAQQGFPRRTVEERVQIAHQKLDSAFKLDNAKLTDADSVFANFYRSADKTREEMVSSGQTDFQ